jgi:hypothetical protein
VQSKPLGNNQNKFVGWHWNSKFWSQEMWAGALTSVLYCLPVNCNVIMPMIKYNNLFHHSSCRLYSLYSLYTWAPNTTSRYPCTITTIINVPTGDDRDLIKFCKARKNTIETFKNGIWLNMLCSCMTKFKCLAPLDVYGQQENIKHAFLGLHKCPLHAKKSRLV